MRNSRSGMVLIVVAGALGVLAALAVSFASLARLERSAAEQHLLSTKAYLLARSGVEDALSRLAREQDFAYGGEDYNNDKALNPGFEASYQVYKRGELNREDCPVRLALRPSFYARAFYTPAQDPDLVDVGGQKRGYTGRLWQKELKKGARQGLEEGQFALKVLPEEGFFLNGGDPETVSDPTQTSDYNINLRRMLGVLAEAVDWEADGKLDGAPVGRAGGGFQRGCHALSRAQFGAGPGIVNSTPMALFFRTVLIPRPATVSGAGRAGRRRSSRRPGPGGPGWGC